MFSMGRFDPRVEVEQNKAQLSEKPLKSSRNVVGSNALQHEDISSREIEHHLNVEEKGNESDGNTSSSVPSSDESSSSAPSSEDESVGGDSQLEEPVMKVIAPEQATIGMGTKRKRHQMTDEGMDDFDETEEREVERSPEVLNALKLSKQPIREVAKLWRLAPFLVKNLEEDDYDKFFPIQALVIPDIIASERHSHIRNRDVCVSAPTGSGKTLSFVLPVLNSLAGRRVRRLRALVVLPSRDLASQVHAVFERYSCGSDLKIGLAIGQANFEGEQSSLIVGTDHRNDSIECRRYRYALNPYDINHALHASSGILADEDYSPLGGYCTYGVLKDQEGLCATPNGGASTLDILVCTPGRLIRHLESTPGFTLQHLRFLIIDEADRLVNQRYQNWIHRVIKASSIGPEQLFSSPNGFHPFKMEKLDPVTWRREQGDPTNSSITAINKDVCQPVQLRKLLFSATLTKDPRKLASLGLVNPKNFDAHHLNTHNAQSNSRRPLSKTSYSLPESLAESLVECTAEQKPLVLLAFLLEQDLLDKRNKQEGIAVIFTSSIDSTHRLSRLLQLLYSAAGYGPATSVVEFSSSLNQKQRAQLIKRCNIKSNSSSRIRVIVCSDGMSRGMDISSVTAVINYDVPSFAKTYVHRCGRTARAGRSGRAITIMKHGQVTKFKKMRELIDDPDNVITAGIKKDLIRDAIPLYKRCVSALRNVLNAEESDGLSPVASLNEKNDNMVAKRSTKGPRKRTEKVQGSPRRPLSSYNIFFKVQRYLIINGKPNVIDIETIEEIANAPKNTADKKRIHRKSHGKIGFADLAIEISQRWKNCSRKTKLHFESLAKKDKLRYDQQNLAFQISRSAVPIVKRSASPIIVKSESKIALKSIHEVDSSINARKSSNRIEPLPLTNRDVASILDKDTCEYVLSVLTGDR